MEACARGDSPGCSEVAVHIVGRARRQHSVAFEEKPVSHREGLNTATLSKTTAPRALCSFCSSGVVILDLSQVMVQQGQVEVACGAVTVCCETSESNPGVTCYSEQVSVWVVRRNVALS